MAKVKVSPAEISAATQEAARKKGTGSFILDILGAPLLRRPALSKAVGKYREGLTKADIAAGEVAGKTPGIGGIFKEEIKTPVKTVGDLEVSQVRKVKRLSAPLAKAQRFLVPVFAYEGLRRMLSGGKEEAKAAGENGMMTREEQVALTKAASLIEKLGKEREQLIEMLASALHEKHAMKLAREMAERGLIAAEDMDKKASELVNEPDLGIVKKAIDLSQKGFELGKVEKTASIEGFENGELDPMTEYLAGYVNGR